MARRFHTSWLFVLAASALVAAVWLARPETRVGTTDLAAHGEALALASRMHASVATVAARPPVPCAKSEQPRGEMLRLVPSVAEPDDAIRPARTPLYAMLRVFRL